MNDIKKYIFSLIEEYVQIEEESKHNNHKSEIIYFYHFGREQIMIDFLKTIEKFFMKHPEYVQMPKVSDNKIIF